MEYLAHHGILKQKWGVRRYQNYDGTLTAEGRERYGRKAAKLYYKERVEKQKADRSSSTSSSRNHKYKADTLKADRKYYESMLSDKDIRRSRRLIADKRKLAYQSVATTGLGMIGLGSAFVASGAAAPAGVAFIGGGTVAVLKSAPNIRYYSRQGKENKG